eukprot:7363006-Lingulodinium_polyedra.AAC.1
MPFRLRMLRAPIVLRALCDVGAVGATRACWLPLLVANADCKITRVGGHRNLPPPPQTRAQ